MYIVQCIHTYSRIKIYTSYIGYNILQHLQYLRRNIMSRRKRFYRRATWQYWATTGHLSRSYFVKIRLAWELKKGELCEDLWLGCMRRGTINYWRVIARVLYFKFNDTNNCKGYVFNATEMKVEFQILNRGRPRPVHGADYASTNVRSPQVTSWLPRHSRLRFGRRRPADNWQTLCTHPWTRSDIELRANK